MINWALYGFLFALGVVLLLALWSALELPRPF